MGIDFLDIVFRIEREFSVKIPRERLAEWLTAVSPPKNVWADLRVQDLVDFVIREIQDQNPAENVNVFERVKKQIIASFGIPESEVTLDAWLVSDLGME